MMPQPQPMGMAPQMPPMPSPQEIERAQAILEAVSWEEIEPILRTDERRNYSIDIETDSTVFQDAETEKAQRIEVMGAMTQWLERAIPAIQTNRSLAPLMKELTMFTLGAFKIGRQLEETFEDAFDQIKDMPEQPNPEQQKLEMEAKAKEAEFAGKQKDREADMVFKQQEHDLKQQGMQAELAFKEQELGFKQREMEMKEASEAFKMHLGQQQHEDDREAAMIEREAAQEDRLFDQELKERDAAGKEQERAAKVMGGAASATSAGGGSAPKAANMGSFLQGLAKQVSQAVAAEMSEQQMMIAKALQGIAQQQDETTEALTAVVGHITAPVNVKRDPRTRRAIGVERGQNSDTDLRAMLEKMAKGRQLVRGADNRIEAFN